jgi:hypothetical protein
MTGDWQSLKMEVRCQVGSTQPCWSAETNRDERVAIEMGTNTTRRRGVVRVWFRCGSGTAAQAADAVHARLQQHAQGRDGEQYEVRPTSANKPTTTGVEESQEHASAGRDAVGKQGMQQKSVTVPGPSRLRASISVANGPRSILGYYDAARLRRCYIQTAHTLLEKSRKEMGWHGAWGGRGEINCPVLACLAGWRLSCEVPRLEGCSSRGPLPLSAQQG